jgi:hypothetical protein
LTTQQLNADPCRKPAARARAAVTPTDVTTMIRRLKVASAAHSMYPSGGSPAACIDSTMNVAMHAS